MVHIGYVGMKRGNKVGGDHVCMSCRGPSGYRNICPSCRDKHALFDHSVGGHVNKPDRHCALCRGDRDDTV